MTDKTELLLDSNVVMNYDNAGILCVLSLVNEHIGQIYILTAVLVEVGFLSDAECARRGFKVIEHTWEEGGHTDKLQVSNALSGVDKLCLAVAQTRGYICVTDDKKLQKSCSDYKVECPGATDLVSLLREKQQITANEAEEYVNKIKNAPYLKWLANRSRNSTLTAPSLRHKPPRADVIQS